MIDRRSRSSPSPTRREDLARSGIARRWRRNRAGHAAGPRVAGEDSGINLRAVCRQRPAEIPVPGDIQRVRREAVPMPTLPSFVTRTFSVIDPSSVFTVATTKSAVLMWGSSSPVAVN